MCRHINRGVGGNTGVESEERQSRSEHQCPLRVFVKRFGARRDLETLLVLTNLRGELHIFVQRSFEKLLFQQETALGTEIISVWNRKRMSR